MLLTRPAGHEAEARKSEAKTQKFFEVEATMYEAEARQQLSVYEHED